MSLLFFKTNIEGVMNKIDLSGRWKLQQSGEGELALEGAVPIRIPGDTFSALIESAVIPDPYYGTNELDTLWVGRADWLLSRTVSVDRQFLEHRQAFLHVDSIDTWAEVRVNGEPVSESRNMFRALNIELGAVLKPGENLIEVLIRSPEKQAAELSGLLPYPVPHTVYPVQSPHRNLLRKVQCHGGWDWGPCLMAGGLYGEVYIGFCEAGRIDCLSAGQTRRGKVWELAVTVDFFACQPGTIPLQISAAGEQLSAQVPVQAGLNTLTRTLEVSDPELWWPAGWGEQKLYTLSVKAGEQEMRKEIGFRTIEVLLEEDRSGRSMTFAVNGRKLFCKGANWIPVDALPGRQSPERYEKLLVAAAAANMNMLRVWGGGQYEAEIFYSLCDRKGLLVWQDFMFSCSLYPSAKWFLDSVEEEVRYQVKRLKHHPCIALWCGNNENLGALSWFGRTESEQARYLVDYDRLNEGVVGRIVRQLDPGRTWWPSSPCAGEGDYSDNWHDDSRGDMHYWSVWHEGKGFEAYYQVTPRFCSEFGFQSFPSLETVRSFAPQEQWNLTSPVLEHHQRSPRGNSIIVETMTRYFRLPESFEGFLYLSQVQQALAMKTAVEYWRSRRPVCMGALYWQLNDLWPAASWSSLEYSGKWKLLHYAARRFYAPLLVTGFCADGRNFEIVGINDTQRPVRGSLQVRFLDFSGSVRLEETIQAELAAEAATPLALYPPERLPAAREEIFVTMELFGPTDEPRAAGKNSGRDGARVIAANDCFLCPPKRCALEKPEIAHDLRLDGDQVVVSLQTVRPAFYVSLDVEGLPGNFDDNLLTLLPGESRELRYCAEQAAGTDLLERFKGAWKLFDLKSTCG